MRSFVRDPFKLIVVVAVVAILGLSGLVATFLSAHPYFNPLKQTKLPKGWIDEQTYISGNYTIRNGEKVADVFGYMKAGGQSILILAVQPLSVEEKGNVSIVFNGIELGTTFIETTTVVSTSLASCCFVTLIQAGVDNVVEITSNGYEGRFRYFIKIPTP